MAFRYSITNLVLTKSYKREEKSLILKFQEFQIRHGLRNSLFLSIKSFHFYFLDNINQLFILFIKLRFFHRFRLTLIWIFYSTRFGACIVIQNKERFDF